MGPDVVIGLSILLCQYLNLLRCVGYLPVQQLISQLSVEALHVAALPLWSGFGGPGSMYSVLALQYLNTWGFIGRPESDNVNAATTLKNLIKLGPEDLFTPARISTLIFASSPLSLTGNACGAKTQEVSQLRRRSWPPIRLLLRKQ